MDLNNTRTHIQTHTYTYSHAFANLCKSFGERAGQFVQIKLNFYVFGFNLR